MFFLDGTQIGSQNLATPANSLVASASLTTTIATAGNHTLTAVYVGNTNYEPITINLLNGETVSRLLRPRPPLSPPPTTASRYEPQLSVNGVIGGAAGAGLTSDGPGFLFLNKVNTYTGITTVKGPVAGAPGTLVVGINNTLPRTPLVIGTGGNVDLNEQADTVASLSGTGNLNLNGSGANLSVGTDNTSTTFSGVITGGGRAKVGTGTLTLTGNSRLHRHDEDCRGHGSW